MRFFYIFLFLLVSGTFVFPQEKYFYTGKDYGSQSLYNPFYLILNGSYDVIQMEGSDRKIFGFPYRNGSRNVLKNLSSPFGPISRYGWWKFLRNEILPLEFAKNRAQWFPNYQLHLIGGGMTYTAMKEWYEYNKFPYPAVFSVATLAGFHLINEFVENGSYQGDNVDPISDIYVFDMGGIVLFSFDGVKKFFKEDLNMADWSLMPSFNFHDLSLQNSGQYFSVKWKIPRQDNWHLFYYFGMSGLGGLSYKFKDGTAVSAGAGLKAQRRYIIDPKTYQMTISTVWNAGFFYDRDNSLLASVFFSGLEENAINVNIYPGIIKFEHFSPGLWMIMQRNGKLMFGLTTVYAPGFGFK
ncbi:MAG TPA: hypothetical protein VHO03_05510 [Ignavibacteriales bacterium]|nr:hypothetical protein [Ignavibacteriales bacterium]